LGLVGLGPGGLLALKAFKSAWRVVQRREATTAEIGWRKQMPPGKLI